MSTRLKYVIVVIMQTPGAKPPIRPPLNELARSYEAPYVARLEAFQEVFDPCPGFVYYPFCGDDAAPWVTFPDSTIAGIDWDGSKIARLEERGIDSATVGDARNARPIRSPDVLLLLGWQWEEVMKEFAASLKPEGYIITNSFMAAGNLLGLMKDSVELVGRIDSSSRVETDPESNGLGYLQTIIKEHSTAGPIARIGLEVQLTNPEMYRNNWLIMQAVEASQ